MIACRITNTKEIEIYTYTDSVEMYFTDIDNNESAIEMSRPDTELLLTRLMEALNKLERKP